MLTVCERVSAEELEARYVRCQDATASRHFQVIWLLARGHTVSQVSATTAFGERWIDCSPVTMPRAHRQTILKPDLLAKLRGRLGNPPPYGGLWPSRDVAVWMAAELGLTSVAPQRGWEALRRSAGRAASKKPEIGHA
jgi:hypothetical protein